jgi:hypothetical protein
MKNSKQFKIGNFVEYRQSVCEVRAIHSEGICLNYLGQLTTDEPFDKVLERSEPIPIDRYFLLKMGFVNDEFTIYRWYKKGKNDETLITYDSDDYTICIGDSWEFPVVKYVHEMQNIYYAIFREELIK